VRHYPPVSIPPTSRAEIAFVVQDAWQNRGIETFMLKHLTAAAKQNGIAGFTADVLRENRAMRTVLEKSNCRVTGMLEEGVYKYQLDFV